MFTRPKKAPQFADLKSILANTPLDSATYQLIQVLIERLSQYQTVVAEQIAEIIATASKNQGNNGGSSSIKPHAPTHRAGGTDPVQITQSQVDGLTTDLANVAKTNVANTFTQPQTINGTPTKALELQGSTAAGLVLNNTSESIDAHKARLIYYGRNIRLDFVNDAESLTVGNLFTFNRDTGLMTVTGGGQFNGNVNIGADLIVNGAYKSPNNTLAMIISNTTIAMYNDGYDWVNKANTTYLMRLNSSGALWIASTINSNGAITAPNFITDGNNNEVAKFVAPNYARAHWRDMSAAPGNQTWVVMNYAGYMRIVPTSDDGLTPYNNDWGRSLYIGRSGDVNIGPGGLIVNRVINASGLAYGQYIPEKSGLVNISALTAYEANYMRVGNTVTVSGQASITIVNPGLYQFLLAVPIANVGYGAGVFQPANSGIQAGYVSHNSSYPNFIMFSSYISSGGTQIVYYTYTYNVV